LEKRPADRPQSASEIVQVLDAVVTPNGGMRSRPLGRATAALFAHPGVRMGGLTVVAVFAVAVAAATWRIAMGRATAPSGAKSIAVVPFENLGGKSPDDSAFSKGVAGEIADALSRIPGLTIRARGRSADAWTWDKDGAKVGQRLGVGWVLQGTVQRAGEQVHITAQLVDATKGTEVNAGDYRSAFKDIFAVQDTIARAIASELRVKLAGAQQHQVVRAATTNPEAHTLYLQGLYLWNKRTYLDIEQARSLFEQAVAKDPRYAQAHAGVALAYAVLPLYADLNNEEAWARAVGAARRALAIDSTSAEAHAAIGFVDMGMYRNAAADREFRRAIELDPSLASARQWLGAIRTRFQGFDEGVRDAMLARDLDPQSRVIQTAVGTELYQARRYAEAESVLRQVMRFDPSYVNTYRALAIVLLAQHRTAEAVEVAEQHFEHGEARVSFAVAILGVSYAANGQTKQARALLTELLDRSRHQPVNAAGIALLYDALGDRPSALQWLERAVARHDQFQLWGRGPLADGLRSDPRGAALFSKIESPNADLPQISPR
jgi:serine/threonine-protein kinase